MTASSMVTRKRSFNWVQTGVLYHRDVPRSPQHSQPARVLDINGPVKAQPLPQLLELFW